jgi:hypothetical protein
MHWLLQEPALRAKGQPELAAACRSRYHEATCRVGRQRGVSQAGLCKAKTLVAGTLSDWHLPVGISSGSCLAQQPVLGGSACRRKEEAEWEGLIERGKRPQRSGFTPRCRQEQAALSSAGDRRHTTPQQLLKTHMQPLGKNDDRRRGMKAEGAVGAARAHPPPTRAGLVRHAPEAGTPVVTYSGVGGALGSTFVPTGNLVASGAVDIVQARKVCSL